MIAWFVLTMLHMGYKYGDMKGTIVWILIGISPLVIMWVIIYGR